MRSIAGAKTMSELTTVEQAQEIRDSVLSAVLAERDALQAKLEADKERLDWLQSECVFQQTIPQFWVARNGRYSYSITDDETLKKSEGSTLREAIDAARKDKP
jgi:hypothetical protein